MGRAVMETSSARKAREEREAQTAPVDTEPLAEVDALALLLAKQFDVSSDKDMAQRILAAGYVSPTTHAAQVRQAQAEALRDEAETLYIGGYISPLARERILDSADRLAAGGQS